MKFLILLLLQIFILLPIASLAGDVGKAPLIPNQQKSEVTEAQKVNIKKIYGKLPLYFIENKGQVDGQVSFYERGAGHTTFFTADGVVIALTKSEGKAEKASHIETIKDFKATQDKKHTTEAVTLSFVGSNEKVKITADEKQTGHVNYFVGNDKSKWRSNIPTYGAVTYEDVYKNIDIKFYGNNKNIEHDVVVRPGGDPSLVQFAYKGVKGLKITESGDLEVSLNHGNIIEQKPIIYQVVNGEKVAVDGSFTILKGDDKAFTYGFTVASYDRTKELVIDPVLVYSTYLGGSGDDWTNDIAVDSSGAAYVTGFTQSLDFPLMNPIYGLKGRMMVEDVFITKIKPDGSAIIYSTYLGGSGRDEGRGIAVDASGATYVTGFTQSIDFPLINPIQIYTGYPANAFVTKIDSTGTALAYSTYLGGGYDDRGASIAVDSTGAAYVTGLTQSTDFPLVNPVQGVFGGIGDAFVTKVNSLGSAFVYSTFLGGSDLEEGSAIAVDSTGAAYITGDTRSLDFPLMHPMQAVYGGGPADAFIMKLNSAGSALAYSTYLGGLSEDYGYAIAVDSAGATYVTGTTGSVSFPLMNPLQGAHMGGFKDAFISQLTPAGTSLAYSTFLGGFGKDYGEGIAVDSTGAVYVTGLTDSTNFPLMNPIQATYGGSGIYATGDAFVTEINPAGSAYVYSTYLGGSDGDSAVAIAVDSTGAAYVTGVTNSTDFPLKNPIQTVHGGGTYDAFVSKISGVFLPNITLAIIPDATTVAHGGVLGYTVTATNNMAIQQCFKYWENVTLPNSSPYPPTGTLFGPVNLCLNAGASKSAYLTHSVPMSAPVGIYIFNATVSTNTAPIASEAHFNFDVTAFGPMTNHPATSWSLIKNGFRK